MKFIIANEISVDFHNDSNYDYHFIIKELANEFEGKFEWLGGNKEKYKTFSITIEKGVTEIDKDSNRSVVTISYKIKFIDSARFIATSLSNLFDNLTEEIHKRKCKDCDYYFFNMKALGIIWYVYLVIKITQKKIDEELKKQFKFSYCDINKFIVKKRCLSDEYMDNWEKFNETTL